MTEITAGKAFATEKTERLKVVQSVETPFGANVITHLVVPSDVADKRYVAVGGGGGWNEKAK